MVSDENAATHGPAARLTATQWLYQQLHHRIMRGELAPGQALRQQHLASEFGLSAIPVREALRMLEADRFVTIQPNRGAVVRGVSLADALEVVDLRLALEPLAISMAVERMTRANVEQSRAILDRYAHVDDAFEWLTLKRAFHFSLYRPCGSPRLLGMVESLFDDVLRFAHLNISSRQGNAPAHREHKRIWRACRDGDAKRAAKRLKAHIERSKQSLTSLLQEHRSH